MAMTADGRRGRNREQARLRYHRMKDDPEWAKRNRARRLAWRKKNRDKINKKNLAAYRKKRQDPKWLQVRLERADQWKRDNPEAFKKSQIRSKLKRYGLSVEDYDRILEAQGGLCAICGQAEAMKRGDTTWELSVDHDHETGAVRGLLCYSCNQGVGRFRDDPHLLRMAAQYLEANADNRSCPSVG